MANQRKPTRQRAKETAWLLRVMVKVIGALTVAGTFAYVLAAINVTPATSVGGDALGPSALDYVAQAIAVGVVGGAAAALLMGVEALVTLELARTPAKAIPPGAADGAQIDDEGA